MDNPGSSKADLRCAGGGAGYGEQALPTRFRNRVPGAHRPGRVPQGADMEIFPGLIPGARKALSKALECDFAIAFLPARPEPPARRSSSFFRPAARSGLAGLFAAARLPVQAGAGFPALPGFPGNAEASCQRETSGKLPPAATEVQARPADPAMTGRRGPTPGMVQSTSTRAARPVIPRRFRRHPGSCGNRARSPRGSCPRSPVPSRGWPSGSSWHSRAPGRSAHRHRNTRRPISTPRRP